MCKAIDKGMQVQDLRLLYKAGGKSGTFEAKPS
jgi:cyclic pyranopterin phosphate synthase